MCSYVDIQHEIDVVVENFFAEIGNLESDRADRTVLQLYLELLNLPLSTSEMELSDHLREMPAEDLIAFMQQQCFDVAELRKAMAVCPHNSVADDDGMSDNASVVVHDEHDSDDTEDDDDFFPETELLKPEMASPALEEVLPKDEPAMTVTESYLKNCSIM